MLDLDFISMFGNNIHQFFLGKGMTYSRTDDFTKATVPALYYGLIQVLTEQNFAFISVQNMQMSLYVYTSICYWPPLIWQPDYKCFKTILYLKRHAFINIMHELCSCCFCSICYDVLEFHPWQGDCEPYALVATPISLHF